MIKVRASGCEIREVESLQEKDFLNKFHYQGYVPSRVCYGLYKGEELLELMSFGEPRYNKKYSWELLRLCTKEGYQLYGGASKLFHEFLEKADIGLGVISYCNRDKFSGKVYEALGFVSNGITKGYHYEKDGKLFHRSNFTKARCLQIWPQYKGQKITEREIMNKQGYNRIEDEVGQELFIFGDKAKMYIYKIVFEDGATYVGQHIQYKEDDPYITSSTYAQNHKVQSKEILVECNDRYTLNLLETIAIVDDKTNSPHNVNGNLGNYVFKVMTGCVRNYSWSDSTRRRFKESMLGHEVPEETRVKIAKALKGKKRTEEQRKRIAESHKGIKRSEEAKRKTSDTLKKKAAEGKHKCFQKGHEVPIEVRMKIAQTMKGRESTHKTVKGYRWYNNGEKNVRAVVCPDGYVLGRI